MSAIMLKTIVHRALHAVGFRGYSASIYYRNGRATVKLSNGYTGIYDVRRGAFVDWVNG